MNKEDNNSRVEHKDHKDSLRSLRPSTAKNTLPLSTEGDYMCSPRQNAVDRADDNGRVEHKEHKELLDEVRQIAYGLHLYLGIGLLEKVYENGLKHRLELAGHKVEAQKPLKVYDRDGFELGEYFVDLYVDNCLIIELKATKTITAEHLAQTLNYLSIMKQKVALLINFGSFKFECRSVVNGRVGNSRVEHKVHKASLRSLRLSTANNSLPLSTDSGYICSPRQNAEDRADDNGRVEHKDHKDSLRLSTANNALPMFS